MKIFQFVLLIFSISFGLEAMSFPQVFLQTPNLDREVYCDARLEKAFFLTPKTRVMLRNYQASEGPKKDCVVNMEGPVKLTFSFVTKKDECNTYVIVKEAQTEADLAGQVGKKLCSNEITPSTEVAISHPWSQCLLYSGEFNSLEFYAEIL
ncbi:unnamed protein product, partial [Mesorhabditis belari]|uniref:Secreted protein n=1 Tax=Mesorhabditis belari TaxID=2138241 RepID=A0AAF3ESD1_9BILA